MYFKVKSTFILEYFPYTTTTAAATTTTTTTILHF
jgi:hypothetical protein